MTPDGVQSQPTGQRLASVAQMADIQSPAAAGIDRDAVVRVGPPVGNRLCEELWRGKHAGDRMGGRLGETWLIARVTVQRWQCSSRDAVQGARMLKRGPWLGLHRGRDSLNSVL